MGERNHNYFFFSSSFSLQEKGEILEILKKRNRVNLLENRV